MGSRAHRWKGDDHPLSSFHGGSASAAKAAIQASKLAKFEEARTVTRAIVASNLDAYERRDRLRPRAHRDYASGGSSHWPQPTTTYIRAPEDGTRAAVWAKCGGDCEYCGKPMMRANDEPMSFTLDHDIPKSRGGKHVLSNLVGAHRKCNGEKGSLTGDEYRAVLAIRASFKG